MSSLGGAGGVNAGVVPKLLRTATDVCAPPDYANLPLYLSGSVIVPWLGLTTSSRHCRQAMSQKGAHSIEDSLKAASSVGLASGEFSLCID